MSLVLLTPLGECVLRVVGDALRMVETELAGRLDHTDHEAFYRLLEALPECVEQALRARFAPAPPL
jgi:hypothetical protein